MGTKRFRSVLHVLSRKTVLQGKVKVLGKMNNRFKSMGKFTFYFTTAVYLLAVPFLYFFKGPVDALLPYEAGLCVSLSAANGFIAVKNAWRAVK